ncbi:MAG: radical SAM protein [Candidatus Micrarchaeota archaeon]
MKRYLSILRGEEQPRYLITKRTPAEKPKSLKDAWKKHGLPNSQTTPKYSLLNLKSYIANELMHSCIFCEHRCMVDRTEQTGFCGVGAQSNISSAFVHLGEEPELVPSGTIFFSGCTFRCCFCQNYDISQNPGNGRPRSPEAIADMITGMAGNICNVNFVGGDPTPNLHTILASLELLTLQIPIVWNSNMYLSEEAMQLLDGVVDVYLTDFKYGNNGCAKKLSRIENYFPIISRNHLLANRNSELLIRHLVLPGHVECCTKPILKWIKKNLGPRVRINIMDQYRPEYKADGRRLTQEEFRGAIEFSQQIGLTNTV